jgi:hypothetical protein
VQNEEITQLAIDRRLTLIAFEAMNQWSRDGAFTLHVFHRNNELAGYYSVLHALELIGTTGDYGCHLRAAVIGAMLETCGWALGGVPSQGIRLKESSKARACRRGSGRYACAHRSHRARADASRPDDRRVVDR